jgi:hypothetical protein
VIRGNGVARHTIKQRSGILKTFEDKNGEFNNHLKEKKWQNCRASFKKWKSNSIWL